MHRRLHRERLSHIYVLYMSNPAHVTSYHGTHASVFIAIEGIIYFLTGCHCSRMKRRGQYSWWWVIALTDLPLLCAQVAWQVSWAGATSGAYGLHQRARRYTALSANSCHARAQRKINPLVEVAFYYFTMTIMTLSAFMYSESQGC